MEAEDGRRCHPHVTFYGCQCGFIFGRQRRRLLRVNGGSWLPCPWPFCCNFYMLLCTWVGTSSSIRQPPSGPPSTLGHLSANVSSCHLEAFSRSLNWAAFFPKTDSHFNPQSSKKEFTFTFMWDFVWSVTVTEHLASLGAITCRQKAKSCVNLIRKSYVNVWTLGFGFGSNEAFSKFTTHSKDGKCARVRG